MQQDLNGEKPQHERMPMLKISPSKARQTFSIFNKRDTVGTLNGSSYKPVVPLIGRRNSVDSEAPVVDLSKKLVKT